MTKTAALSTNPPLVATNPGAQPENGVVKHEGVNGIILEVVSILFLIFS